MRMGNGVVFAVAGSKGGVGKTTTSINLSAVLAEMGYEVVLVEMDLAMANVGDFLDIDVGLEGEDPTLHEVLAGTSSVVDATYDSPCGFDIVPSGATLQGFSKAQMKAVSGALSTLRFAYDVVLFDTGAGVTTETMVSIALADETILVSTPRVASVRDTMKTRDLVRQVGGTVAGVVFVKSGTGRSPGVEHIAEFLSVDLLGHIPEDDAVPSAQDVGRPVVTVTPESDAAKAYRELGDRIRGRLSALTTADPAVLSTDSGKQDRSGFAFLEESEADGTTGEAAVDGGSEPEGKEASGATGNATTTQSNQSTAVNGRAQNEVETPPSPTHEGTDSSEAQSETPPDSDDTTAPDDAVESTAANASNVMSNGQSADVDRVKNRESANADDDSERSAEQTRTQESAEAEGTADGNEPVEALESTDDADRHEAGEAKASTEFEQNRSDTTEGDGAASESTTKRVFDRARSLIER